MLLKLIQYFNKFLINTYTIFNNRIIMATTIQKQYSGSTSVNSQYLPIKINIGKNIATFDNFFRIIDEVRQKNDYGIMRYTIVIPKFGYGVPDKVSICEITKFIKEENIAHILSIGSGVGFVECYINILLGRNTITATDPLLSHGLEENIINRWMEIEKLDHNEAIEKYGSSIDGILLNWSAMDAWFGETVREAVRLRIKYIIYIGETGGCPCTGDEETLEYIDKHYETVKEIYYIPFINLNDYITIYKIKNIDSL